MMRTTGKQRALLVYARVLTLSVTVASSKASTETTYCRVKAE